MHIAHTLHYAKKDRNHGKYDECDVAFLPVEFGSHRSRQAKNALTHVPLQLFIRYIVHPPTVRTPGQQQQSMSVNENALLCVRVLGSARNRIAFGVCLPRIVGHKYCRYRLAARCACPVRMGQCPKTNAATVFCLRFRLSVCIGSPSFFDPQICEWFES